MYVDPAEMYEDPFYAKLQGTAYSDIGSATQLASGFNESNWLKYAQDQAASGNEAWAEKLFNYYATRDADRTAREWSAKREDGAWQRLVKDLNAAGISPYIMSSASPIVSSASGRSYSGSEVTSRFNNQNTNDQNELTRNTQTVLRLVGTVASALIMALLAA